MLSQLFNRSTAIFRNPWGYRPMARFFATRSSFLCKVCQLRVSHLKGSVHQHAHHTTTEGHMGTSGGLVEIDDQGKVVRASSNADPTFADALLTPYSLVVLPEFDRVVSTNSSMHQDDIFRGVTYQLWRLSDLKLLKTDYFDVGENRYGQGNRQSVARRHVHCRTTAE